MNLKDIQIKKTINNIILSFLKNGTIPKLKDVLNEYNKIFKLQSPGYPKFKPITVKKNTLSSAFIHNKMVDDIYMDIEDLYDADKIYFDSLLSTYGLYITEIEHTNSKLTDIQNRINMLLNNKLYNNISYTIHDCFNDFLKIDFNGDPELGIIKTNSFIDLRTHSVSNNIITNNSKISLYGSDTKLTVPDNVIENKTIYPIENALKDTLNEIWLQSLTTKDNLGIVIRLSVELVKEIECTDIEFELYSSRSVNIKLYTFDSNKQQQEYKSVDTDNLARWNFKKRKVKVITFEVQKNDADGQNDNLEYEYYIGSKNISIYNNIYQSKSTMVSIPYYPSNPFNYAHLDLKQVTPPESYINYYIGIGYDGKQTHWHRIKNGDTIDLKLLSKNEKYINNTTDEYGNKIDNYYKLCKIDNTNVVLPSIELYIGNNMWERKKYNIKANEKNYIKKANESLDIDYIGLDRIVYNTIEINGIKRSTDESAKIDTQPKNTCYIYTTYVYCDISASTKATISSNGILNLYINGIEINIEEDYTVLRFDTGWNKVQFISTALDKEVKFMCNVYFYEIADKVRALKDKIKYVTKYHMDNNIHNISYEHFTIIDNCICVNYNPKDIYMSAYLKYMYMYDTTVFDNVQIRLMAILESENSDITPLLKEYNILLI